MQQSKWITSDEFLKKYGIRDFELLELIKKGLQPYSRYRKEPLYCPPKNHLSSILEEIISQLKPLSILDIFIGSGTTAEVAESLGIPWLGYEIKSEYIQDIEERIQRGIEKKKYHKKQRTLF